MKKKIDSSGLLIAVSMLFILLLVGCGNVNEKTGSESEQQAETEQEKEAEESSVSDVRQIQHAMGTTEMKGTPKRVVILTNEGTEALLALGVKPVGAVQSWTGEPWYEHIQDEMEGVEAIGFETEPNLEAILDLNPDLIIGNKVRHEKIYEQLNKIAPTIFSEELSGQWKVNFKLYAETLNKTVEGEQKMKEFDDRVAAAKEELGEKLATKVSIVRFSLKDVRIYQKDTFSGVLLEQLGMARPASQDVDNFIETVSEEAMEVMDGDIMFYFLTEEAAGEVASQWLASPVFKSLNVAKNNQVYEVNETIWNTAGGIKAANLLLDDILKRLQ